MIICDNDDVSGANIKETPWARSTISVRRPLVCLYGLWALTLCHLGAEYPLGHNNDWAAVVIKQNRNGGGEQEGPLLTCEPKNIESADKGDSHSPIVTRIDVNYSLPSGSHD